MQRLRHQAATPGQMRRTPRRTRASVFAALAAALGLMLFAFAGSAAAAVTCPYANPVANENNCAGAGTTANQVTNYSDNLGGFTTQTSYNVGQNVDLKIGVKTPKAGGPPT